MTTTRRDFLRLAGSTAAVALAAPAIVPGFARAAGDLRKVRWGISVTAMNVAVVNSIVGEGLGYNAEEGFELEPVMLGSNSNVQIALDKGDVDFGVGTGPFQLPLFAKGELPPIVNFYEWCYPYRWDIAVLPDSKAQSYADLKGKTIGVSALGTTDYPIARAALTNVGVDPDKDVSWVATGAGVPAGVALQRGTIDALAYFDTGFGQVEAAGIPIRILPRPENTPMIGGLYVSARKEFLEKNTDLAVSFGRSISRASQFILANPEAGAKVFLKMYPELAPRGVSEEEAVKTLLYPIKRRMAHFEPPYPDTVMGYIHADELVREAKFLGLDIESADEIVRTDLMDRINDYDLEKVKEQAANYKG